MFLHLFLQIKALSQGTAPERNQGCNFDDFCGQLCAGSGRELALEMSFFGCSHIL